MWVKVKDAPSLMLAEMWKEFFEAEGIPARILPDPKRRSTRELSGYDIYVSQEKVHVVNEVLRKL
jgi:hypothetical protein